MRVRYSLVLLLLLLFSVSGYAQESQSAAESAEQLKLKLADVKAREEELHLRLQQLDESLNPENIERSLAGVGSTRPEELRESRRRQLTIERDGVIAQLKILETSRQRLETAVGNAEALVYLQSARPTQRMAASSSRRYQWLMLGGGGLAVLALGGGAFIFRRKLRLRK